MAASLQNTLEIIGNLTKCSGGYVLKFNDTDKKILASIGENNNVLDLESIYLSFKKDEKYSLENKLKKTISSKAFLKSHSWGASLIKSMPGPSSSRKDYYVILFSQSKENFSKKIMNSVTPMLNELSEQIIFSENLHEKRNIKAKIGNINTGKILSSKHSILLESLFEVSEDLIFVLDKDGCIIKINPYGAACLEYDSNELYGTHLIGLVAPRFKNTFAKSFKRILEEDSLLTIETALLSKIGNEITFQINYKVIKESEKILGVVGIGKNITELRSYEEKINDLNLRLIEANRTISLERQRSNRQKAILAELNKMKSEFVSNISHELRTPLASIIGFSETISSDPNMPAEMKQEFNEIILNEGKRLAKLINDVLDISKLEGGQIELSKTSFDVIILLQEALESNKKSMDIKKIHLTVELPSEPVILKADKEKLFRVFTSLINNAIKFNYPKGRITITAQSLYKEFELTISDTGIGIPEKDLPYIFQKFYRVSRPGNEIPGTGLGLVFVKQIVDLHKGFLSINSELNKGTTVLLKLPKEIRV